MNGPRPPSGVVETRNDHIRQSSLNLGDDALLSHRHPLSTIAEPAFIEQNILEPRLPETFTTPQENRNSHSGDCAKLYSTESLIFTLAGNHKDSSYEEEIASWSHSRSNTPTDGSRRRSRSRSSITRNDSQRSQSSSLTQVGSSRRLTQGTLDSAKPKEKMPLEKTPPKRKRLSKKPPPLIIHGNKSFLNNLEVQGLDKFEDKYDDTGTPATEEITPITPNSLGIPDPPGKLREESRLEQQTQPSRPPPGPPPPNWSKLHEYAFIFNVCLAQFITLAALAQTVAPLSIIGADMQVDHPGQKSWFTAAYSMSLGTFILPAGKSILLFIVGSAKANLNRTYWGHVWPQEYLSARMVVVRPIFVHGWFWPLLGSYCIQRHSRFPRYWARVTGAECNGSYRADLSNW
jgi:hypothetical protein